MDYDVLNSAIDDIVEIVNQYNKRSDYDVSVSERLVISLFGYYISFGPEIFSKINTVLDALKIIECSSEEELIKIKKEMRPHAFDLYPDPSTIWDYKYKKDNQEFIGAIPVIVYCKHDIITDTLNMIHEISHTLEGVSAKVLYETDEYLEIKHGYGTFTIDKNTGSYSGEGRGITELITITIVNNILKKYMELDYTQIDNPLIKDFVSKLKKYQEKNVMPYSYDTMSAIFKDLIDNETFFNIIKRNYYDNQQETLAQEFNSLDERLYFQRLAKYADKICDCDANTTMYYAGPIQSELDVLNAATGAKPDKRILILI